jgi:uncharacterized protein (TIGR03083 family)
MTGQSFELLLTTGGSCDFDPGHLLEVFAEQRKRFMEILEGFGPEDWAAPTRCADWSAHDVIRHLCECNAIATGTDNRSIDVAAGFDPRITPREWMTASADEPPAVTLARFAGTTEDLFGLAHARLGQRRRFDVRLPYGPMDWTVLVWHAFWDSWIHERDVLLARHSEHPTDDDATLYAAAYGLFVAAAAAFLLFGDQVEQRLTLGGDGGGIFDLKTGDGVITLRATRVTTLGRPAAEVTDALAGRAPVESALGDLPSNSRVALARLADFHNTPVEPSPT